MARKDKPYLPLYVQDILTDEKLIECSAQAHGVYLRLMCILHKQDKYGLLCLKQKYKQNESKIFQFASMLARQMPFAQTIIQESIEELLDEGVIVIDGDTLFQKRMVADGELSKIRSDVGKTGGSNVTKQYGKEGFLYWIGDNDLKNKIGISVNIINRLYRLRSDLKLKKLNLIDSIEVIDMGVAEDMALSFFSEVRDGEWINITHNEMAEKFVLLKANIEAKDLAKHQANADIENDIENANANRIINQLESNNILNGENENEKKELALVVIEMEKVWLKYKPEYSSMQMIDYPALLNIAYHIAGRKGWTKHSVTSVREQNIIQSWDKIVSFLVSPSADNFLKRQTLDGIANPKIMQKIEEAMNQSASKKPKGMVI